MLWDALSTARDLGRLHEIASALIRHGLGDVVRRLGIGAVLERAGRLLHWKGAQGFGQKSLAVRARELCEELGPTFVKLGQILAGRTDLLPPEWTEELAKLHERTAQSDPAQVRAQLVEDLGAEPEEVFAAFDPEPVASASIAQVYRATSKTGDELAVKVRRPGVREVVDADLRLLTRLAEHAEEELPELARFRPRVLVRHFARTLKDELDLRVEARNVKRLAANLVGDELRVPRIEDDLVGERLLVMEFFEGPSLGAWIRAGEPGDADPRELARIGADAVLRMVLVDGFFHADPHPGNVILLEGGRLGLVDAGMVGRLTQARRLEYLRLLAAIVERREDEVVDILLTWSGGELPDEDVFAADCAAFVDRYHGVALQDLDVERLLSDLTALLRDNDLFLPQDVALLLKVFVTLEGLGRALDPSFVMSERIEPFVREEIQKHLSPTAVMSRGAREMGRTLLDLPQDLRRMVRSLGRGRVQMEVGGKELRRFGAKLDRSTNRLTMGIVTAALIVGTAISLTVPAGPRLLGLPVFALIGFLSSIGTGVWLLVSIARSGK